MIIRGILDRSLSSQICIRGFAPIKQLADISRADFKYQRPIVEFQRKRIETFLDTETYLFFPEVILSYRIKVDITKGLKSNLTPLQQIESGKNFKSNYDKTEIKVKKIPLADKTVINQRNDITIIELVLNDSEVEELIKAKRHPLHRIDGNHRLTSAEGKVTKKVEEMNVPFCIILGEEFYDKGKLMKDASFTNFDKSIKVYFHNINTKTVPLTSEQNLNVIINDPDNFPPEELERILKLEGLLTRQTMEKTNNLSVYNKVVDVLEGEILTHTMKVFELLLIKTNIRKTALLRLVTNAFSQVNAIYLTEENISKSKSSFLAMMFYFSAGDIQKSTLFVKWLLETNTGDIKQITAENIIELFEDYFEKSINVFVAMEFPGKSEIKAYNKAYQTAIDKVKSKNPTIKLHLFPVMTHKGKSFDLLNNLLDRIDKSGIVIADITNSNPNVIYELGYARSAKKHIIIVCEESYFKKVPFDFEHDLRRSYKKTALTELEDVVYTDLVAILKDDYKLIINE